MSYKRIEAKPEIRILGVDDGPFNKNHEKTFLICTIFRGGLWLDGLLATKITVDGLDATQKLIEVINKSNHKEQLRVIMLDGITYAGFNVMDIEEIYKNTNLPVIVVMRDKPNFKKIRKALFNNFKDAEIRWRMIQKAGEIYKVAVRPAKYIYIQTKGIYLEDAINITRLSATRSLIPEPIRVAHIIARGVGLENCIKN